MTDVFVLMTKDDEKINVHPLVVEEHKRLGWTVVEKTQAPTSPPAPLKIPSGYDVKKKDLEREEKATKPKRKAK